MSNKYTVWGLERPGNVPCHRLVPPESAPHYVLGLWHPFFHTQVIYSCDYFTMSRQADVHISCILEVTLNLSINKLAFWFLNKNVISNEPSFVLQSLFHLTHRRDFYICLSYISNNLKTLQKIYHHLAICSHFKMKTKGLWIFFICYSLNIRYLLILLV